MLEHIHKAVTKEDFTIAHLLAMRFAENSPYSKYVDAQVVADVINGAMLSEDAVVLLCGESGMIVVSIIPFIYGKKRLAVELAWWVEPLSRGGRIGSALLDAAEMWAKNKGAVAMVMISLDDEVGKYYETRGYELRERTYMKEF